MKYIKEFNSVFALTNSPNLTEIATHLGFINSNCESLVESCNNIDLTEFLVNLHKTFQLLRTESNARSVFSYAVSILEKSIERLKPDLLRRIGFIPVVSDLLPKHPQILSLLLSLTYGFRAERREMFLDDLISNLVGIVLQDSEYSEVALGVLINLLFRNPVCTHIFIRNTSPKVFLSAITGHQLMQMQLRMILGTDSPVDRTKFAALTASEILKTLDNLNVGRLRQIVDFVQHHEVKMFEDQQVQQIICDTERVLEGSQDERASAILGLVLEFFNLLIENTDTSAQRIQSFALQWTQHDSAGATAIATLKSCVEKYKEVGEVAANVPLMLEKVLSNSSQSYKIAFLELVRVLMGCLNAQVLNEEVLDMLLKTFLKEDGDVRGFVNVLFIYSMLANMDKASYYPKFFSLMSSPKTYLRLVQSLRSTDKSTLETSLLLCQLEDFSVKQMAEVLSSERSFETPVERSFHSAQVITQPISQNLENKLDALIGHVTEIKQKEGDLLQIEAIEIYQSKINASRSNIKALTEHQRQLEDQLTQLRQQNALLMAQAEQMEARDLCMTLRIDTLQKDNEKLKIDRENAQTTLVTFNASFVQTKEKVANLRRQLEVKDSEVAEKVKMLTKLEDKLEQAQRKNDEASRQMEQFRESLKKYDDTMKLKQKKLDETVACVESLNRKLAEAQKANAEYGNLVKDLEAQLATREEKLQQYASEVEEAEKMREVVMNLMSKKQKTKK